MSDQAKECEEGPKRNQEGDHREGHHDHEEDHGHHQHHEHESEFCFDFDGKQYETKHHDVTPETVREVVGGIANNVTIVEILEDGTQKTLQEGEKVQLHHCSKFRKLPRFTRGRGRVAVDPQAVLKEYPNALISANDEYFILLDLPLPELFTQASTDLLVVVPPTYPTAPPDNFSVTWGLLLKSGQAIKDYNGPATMYDRQWGTFSHHVDVKTWNGEDGDSFLNFIATARARLQEGA